MIPLGGKLECLVLSGRNVGLRAKLEDSTESRLQRASEPPRSYVSSVMHPAKQQHASELHLTLPPVAPHRRDQAIH